MIEKKKLAIRLRKQAKSYNQITKTLGIPKSTLSGWLKDIDIPAKVQKQLLTNAQRAWAKSITDYNKKRAKLAREKWEERIEKAKKEIGQLTQREVKLIGSALYWAEGYKKGNWAVLFCNSDPEMVMIMMRFYREVCKVPEEKFKPNVQIHPNITEFKARKYWSQISNIPEEKFRKTLYQVPRSSQYKKPANILPYGTFRLTIFDVKLVNKTKGWIKGIAEQGK